MIEKMVETPSNPQVTGHDNMYAADSIPSIIKFELLANGQDNISTIEVVGWIILALILVMLTVLVVRAILNIMRTCQHKTESYNLDHTHKDSDEKYKVTFCPSLPEIVDSTSPPKDMEAAWEELSEQDPDFSTKTSHQ